MLIDLTDIIKDFGGKLPISESFDMQTMHFLGEDFEFENPCSISGAILNNSKTLELHATVSGTMHVHCARCGKPLCVECSFPVSEILVREDADISNDEDVVFYSGNQIELDDIIADSFLLNVSGKYLCKEDCKGLCPHCGINLNEQSCSCEDDIIDPRWEKLAEIMKNMSDTE